MRACPAPASSPAPPPLRPRPPARGRAHLCCPRPPGRVLCHNHRGTCLPSWPGRENTLLPSVLLTRPSGKDSAHLSLPSPGHCPLPSSKWAESSQHPDLLHIGQPGPGGRQHGPRQPKTGPWRPAAVGHRRGCLSPVLRVSCRVRRSPTHSSGAADKGFRWAATWPEEAEWAWPLRLCGAPHGGVAPVVAGQSLGSGASLSRGSPAPCHTERHRWKGQKPLPS